MSENVIGDDGIILSFWSIWGQQNQRCSFVAIPLLHLYFAEVINVKKKTAGDSNRLLKQLIEVIVLFLLSNF